MVKRSKFGWLSLALILSMISAPWTVNAAATGKPAIVLAAFGTSTAAFDTYNHFEKKIVEESRKIPGLKVALGKPLLSSNQDQERVLKAVAQTFPKDLKNTAVVLVAHGSPSPEGESAYLAFARLLRSRYPHQNVFLGTVEGKPSRQEALEAVKQSKAATVVLMPFLFVAGEHVVKDILGDDPESWKSELLKHRAYRIQGITKGLGYQEEIVNIYLAHLAQALQGL